MKTNKNNQMFMAFFLLFIGGYFYYSYFGDVNYSLSGINEENEFHKGNIREQFLAEVKPQVIKNNQPMRKEIKSVDPKIGLSNSKLNSTLIYSDDIEIYYDDRYINEDIVAEMSDSSITGFAINEDIVAEMSDSSITGFAINEDIVAEMLGSSNTGLAINKDIVAEMLDSSITGLAINEDIVAEMLDSSNTGLAVNANMVAEMENTTNTLYIMDE